MDLRTYIPSPTAGRAPLRSRFGSVCSSVFALISFCIVPTLGQAANTHSAAIELYDGANGPAYVQIVGLTVNGKSELRVCDGMPKFDKHGYDSMPKVQLASAGALERASDGTLALTVNGKAMCVVPATLKFDHNAEFTPAEAAEQAALQGVVASASVAGSGIALLKPGTKLAFVASPDAELAEYLLAQRAASVQAWQAFLAHFPSSSRAQDAKNAMAEIYEHSAELAFAEYRKSSSAQLPDLLHLKQAEQQADSAEKVVPGLAASRQLHEQICNELDALLATDRERLQAYRKALSDRSSGYAQLTAAKQHSEQVLEVNPQYTPAVALHSEVLGESRKIETTTQTAEGLLEAKRFDEAFASLVPYRSFAAEMPRIEAVISAVYAYHFGRAQEYGRSQAWEQALAEFRKAAEIRPESKDIAAVVKNAELQMEASRNRQSADAAIAASNSYAEKAQFIEAYETLANLPATQQSFVADQLSALQKNYVAAASKRALKLLEIHLPIRGRADEDAVRQAYELLDRAGALSGDPALKLKLDLLSDKLGAYYIEQAKRYLEKPTGSGVGLGWMYLAEAEHYRPNLESVKDAMARYAPAYQLRSKLSVGVVMRDQTSRRDSVGFADQMRDAIASGLESSGLAIKVVRQSSETPDKDAAQPNFVLVGEILEHRVVKNTNLETLASKYRAATHDVKNEAWLQANRDYEAAQQQLAAAQRELASAQTQHKKKEVLAADSDAIAAAQKAVTDARQKMDATEQTRTENVLEPYNYTRKSIDLAAVVDMAFRIADQSGNPVEASFPIRKEDHKSVVVLDNVKPEDTQGIKKQGTEPDEIQFLTDLEIQTRDALVKAVREKAVLLPSQILTEARRRAQQGDFDGAAEEYILYSNAVSDSATQERQEAAKFLHDHFNVSGSGASNATETRLRAMN